MQKHYLAPLLEPRAIALVGATQRAGAIGAVLVENMRAASYQGTLYAVNPKYDRVGGLACYARIADLPQKIDLAVIATPPATVPSLIDACGAAGIPAAVVITAGFAEVGPQGAALERELVANARRHGVRLLGPNCLGLMRPSIGLDATFARGGAPAGSIGLVSQSGAVCTALLDWARPNAVGFSSVISLGGTADIDFGELIDYLAYDVQTRQILLYVEGIRDARRFVSALRAAARAKPVIVLKSGRHPLGVRAAVSHTGALVGADDVFHAALRRTGAVRVTTIAQLVATAQALAGQMRPQGTRLAIVTNGGGPGVLAADRAADLGVPLAELADATLTRLQQSLPSNWSRGNPVDVIGDADAARFEAAVAACLEDPQVDGVLAILTPQAMTAPSEAARAMVRAAKRTAKPVLASWMGEEQVAAGRALLRKAGLPVFRTPEAAVDMFAHVAAYYANQQLLMQVPPPIVEQPPPDLPTARSLIAAALAAGRSTLTATESKRLLACFHVPVVQAFTAASEDEAVERARAIGFPAVMKIHSTDITHKTEVGGVQLDLASEDAVRHAYRDMVERVRRLAPTASIQGVTLERMVQKAGARELMVGVSSDRVFGPAIAFGTGGIAVEVHGDRAVGLPPLNRFLIREMIEGTRAARMLGAFRGMPAVDGQALENVLLAVSAMVCELPWLRELDINPLLADETGAIAIDARAVVAEAPAGARPYAHMAIHPYPAHLRSIWHAPDGVPVAVRPIRPEDAQIEREFVASLSADTRYLRFMGPLKELSAAMLARFTQVDYDREMALIATVDDMGRERQIAVCRYALSADEQSCEFAIVVAEAWQGRGLGRHLMRRLIDIARERDIRRMTGDVLAVNRGMLDMAARLGFVIADVPGTPSVKQASLVLT